MSGVTPERAFLARTTEVTISGSGTNWTSATTVDFGAGVTVKKLTLASPTALVAQIAVDKAAATGPRDITVNDPAGNTTYTGAFNVLSPLELTFQGTVAQGSPLFAHVKNLDVENPFDTTQGFSGFTNLAVTTGTGVYAAVQNATDFGLDLLVLIDVPTMGTQDLEIVSGPPMDATNDVSFPAPKALNVAARMPTALTAGTPANGTVANAFDSGLYSYTPSSAALSILDFSTTSSATAASPSLYLLPKSGAWLDQLNGGPTFTWLSSATDPFYAVYFDQTGTTGAYTAGVVATAPAANAATTSTDNNKTGAVAATALPFVLTGGNLTSTTAQDWVKVTATSADIGKSFWVQSVNDFLTDVAITGYMADGTTMVGSPVENQNGAGADDGTIGPIQAAGTYYIVFSAGTMAFDPAHGTYQGIIRTK